MKDALKRLNFPIAFVLLNGVLIHGAIIDVSGSVAGMASVDFTGRCAPFPTVTATGTGIASGLGNFVDSQSHCTNSAVSFNQGIFDLASHQKPGDSLFGTYTGTASLQGSLLDFTSMLLVTGGDGTFSGASGTILSSGTLNESTGEFNASFSGPVSTAPEPAALCLIGIGFAALRLIARKAAL